MTPQIAFILAAALLVAVILAILLPPLWRTPKLVEAVDRQHANLEIFRSQLAELERDRNEGALSDADFEQAKNELQRRLLEEATPEAAPRENPGGRKTALALLVALPLATAAAYALLGKPEALVPAPASVTAQQMDDILAKLVARLKANPDDSKGWLMLARSYKALDRIPEAAEAYSHVGELLDNDAALLADYADVLAQLHGGNLAGKPLALVARALKINPEEPMALYLAGVAATDREDYAAVADYWGRLLLQVEPGSQDAITLQAAVDKASEMVGAAKPGGKSMAPVAPVAAAAPAGGKPGKSGAAQPETVSGEVVLSGKVAAQAKPDDLLFIFARTDEGSRMPLAVQRAVVGDLPLSFRFDDSMALPGGQKISELATLSIEARIAKSGMAQTASGDLFGTVKGIKPGSRTVKVIIDQVQP